MCTAPIISPDQADGGPWLKQRTALWTAAKELHKIIAVQAIFLKAAVEHDPHGQALFERRHPSTAQNTAATITAAEHIVFPLFDCLNDLKQAFMWPCWVSRQCAPEALQNAVKQCRNLWPGALHPGSAVTEVYCCALEKAASSCIPDG